MRLDPDLAARPRISGDGHRAIRFARRVLAELGVEPVDATRAAWIVARDVARQMVIGDLAPEVGAGQLWGLWWECDTIPEIGLLLEPLDAWYETLPRDRDDDAVRAWMRRLAPAVVRVAEARIAAGEAGTR